MRIFVCLEPVDMRRGFDRLVQTARERGGHDATMGGMVVVFSNRRATRLKLLWFERNGVCVLYKRLHMAKFELPLSGAGSVSVHIDGTQLAKLLVGATWTSGECILTVWFHKPSGEWVVLDDVYRNEEVAF